MSTVSPDQIVAHRLGGATYEAIALLFDISIARARYVCLKAMRRGDVTPDQIGHRARPYRPRISPEVYDAHWIERVKKGCVVDAAGCWLWQGNLSLKGYGQTNYRTKTIPIHRFMYKIVNKIELSTKQYVCHRCDVRNCCNPEHLFIGTQFDNMADSVRKGRHAEQLVTHCPKGHEYDAENTYVVKKANGKTSRDCKTCARARGRINAGWPEALAYSMPAVPHGHRPVNAPYRRRNKAA